MGALRRTASILGRGGIAALIAAPLLTGILVFALAPVILATKFGASARLDIYPVVGTHASYEVASSISDFGTEYMAQGDAAARASRQSPSDVASLLTATRTEDSALAQIGFQAPTAEGAEKGLRAAAEAALTRVAQGNVTRGDIMVRAAQKQLDATLAGEASPRGVRADLRDRIRQSRLDAATASLQEAQTSQAVAREALARVPTLVAETPVAVERISSTSDAVRLALAAAMTALLLAAAGLTYLRRDRIFRPAQRRADTAPEPSAQGPA